MRATAASERGQGGLERAGSIPRLVRNGDHWFAIGSFRTSALGPARTGAIEPANDLAFSGFEEFQKDGGPDLSQMEPTDQLMRQIEDFREPRKTAS
jgi:hypothetical protein